MNDYAKRITAIRRELCHDSNLELAKRIGKSPQHASALCSGRTAAATGTLDLILANFPTVNRQWLYFGDGAMLLTPTDQRDNLLRDISDTLATLSVQLRQLCSTSAS